MRGESDIRSGNLSGRLAFNRTKETKCPVDWRLTGQNGIKRDLFRAKDSFVINQISQHFRSHFWHKGAHDAALFLMQIAGKLYAAEP